MEKRVNVVCLLINFRILVNPKCWIFVFNKEKLRVDLIMFVRLFNYHVSKSPLNIERDWIKRESKSIYQYDNYACQLTKFFGLHQLDNNFQ